MCIVKEVKDGGVDCEYCFSKSECIVYSEKFINLILIIEFIKVQINEVVKDNKQFDVVKENEGVNFIVMGCDGLIVSLCLCFDIDVLVSGYDDIFVGFGIFVDEWDYCKYMLLFDYCCVQELIGCYDGGIQLFEYLCKYVVWFKQQFSVLVL